MSDIVTSRIFVDGEKNITATKLNDIVASSVIQPAFVSAKPSTSTVAPTDNLLVLTAAGGTYAKAPFQTIIDSVNANLNTNAAIWSVRLRSFNAVGNPTMEVDQRNVGGTVANGQNMIIDRWGVYTNGPVLSVGQQVAASGDVVVPGTNFRITKNFFRFTLTTAKGSLAAGDYVVMQQLVEGPQWRELSLDVHSISMLVRTSVAGLTFSTTLADPANAYTLTKLCTIPSANTWTLVTLPNLPLWPGGGNFSAAPGVGGYTLNICLASGTTYLTSPGAWMGGHYFGATGMSNFGASPVNSTFDIAYISHEPGALCSNPPMDCPFTENLLSCQRHYQKMNTYSAKFPVAGDSGLIGQLVIGYSTIRSSIRFTQRMAKAPTMTLADQNGSVGYIFMDGGAGTGTIQSLGNVSDSGVGIITLTTSYSGQPGCVTGQWQADSGW